MGEIILGIHSNVAGDEQGFIAGHAWLSVTEAGKTTTYGLWPDEHRWIQQQGLSNGDASDIRIGLERNSNAIASRYYKLSPAQADVFREQVRHNVTWRYTNNCSAWASEVVMAVVGEDVDADDYLGIETPRELGRNILALEKRDPTSTNAPKGVKHNPATSVVTSSTNK